MILLPARILLLFAFGIGLFLLWRAAAPPERRLRWIVAAGFLARAAAGQSLFWISWARLPILRSLQTADGYWLFAQDSNFYFPQAAAAAEKGLGAIVSYDRGGASPTYVQLLAFMISLLGRQTSVGLLLNLFCYLGTIALLVRWGRVEPRTRTMTAVAIAGISLTPSLMLWSLQPLKDSLFQFLFVAFAVACATWQDAWLAAGRWRARVVSGTLLAVVLLLIAGIRWYFAGALVAATLVFLLIVAATAAERKTFSFAAAAMMIVVPTAALVLGAGPHLPRGPEAMFAAIEEARRGFDATPAGTTIRSGEGPTIAAEPEPRPPVAPPRFPPLNEKDARTIRALLDEQAEAWNRFDVARAMSSYWRSPQLEIVNGATVIHGWEQAAEDQRRGRSAAGSVRMTGLQFSGGGDGDMATVRGRWEFTSLSGSPQTRDFVMTLHRFPDGQWKIVREVFSPPPVVAAAAPPRVDSRLKRLLVGAAALSVPRFVGERLGLFHIGGGRGLIWFTELDTLIFDLALVFALWVLLAERATPWRNPLCWLILLTTLILAAVLAYSVNNLGTLFRLREMIYLGLLLMPIGVRSKV